MKKEKEKSLLNQAVNEIRSLRKQNELMGARLEMFDNMMLVFKTPPCYPGYGMSEDLTYTIEKHLVAVEEEEKEEMPLKRF